MTLFLILAVLLAIILDGQTQQLRNSFMANPGLNGLIIGVLLVGIVYAFRQVLRLYPEISWVNDFRIADPGITADKTTPVLLAPMATMLRDRTGHLSLATGSMRSMLDSIASRLDEQRETDALSRRPPRLSRPARHLLGPAADDQLGRRHHRRARHRRRRERDAVRSAEGRARRAAQGHGHRLLLLDVRSLRLADPRASSTSRPGHAQGRFYNELEDWLSGITELQPADAASAAAMPPQLRFALMDMQRSLSDLSEKVELRVLNDNTGDAVKDLAARRRQAHPADARRAEGRARMGRRAGPAAAGACRRAPPDHRQVARHAGARGAELDGPRPRPPRPLSGELLAWLRRHAVHPAAGGHLPHVAVHAHQLLRRPGGERQGHHAVAPQPPALRADRAARARALEEGIDRGRAAGPAGDARRQGQGEPAPHRAARRRRRQDRKAPRTKPTRSAASSTRRRRSPTTRSPRSSC